MHLSTQCNTPQPTPHLPHFSSPRPQPPQVDFEDEEDEQAAYQPPAPAPEPVEVHWVQCSRCERWRVVPDAHWGPIAGADEDADWFCQDARWELTAFEPFEPACEFK